MHILLYALVFAKCAGPASSSTTRLHHNLHKFSLHKCSVHSAVWVYRPSCSPRPGLQGLPVAAVPGHRICRT